MLNKILLILTVLFLSPSLMAQEAELKRAETAYSQGDYGTAIKEYEQVLDLSGASATLYYNLGNAYFKNQQYGPAILNYERALLLDPSLANAQSNLDFANAQILDRVERVEPFFLTKWVDAIAMSCMSNTWATMAVVCFLLCFIALFVYFFFSVPLWRKLGFFSAIVFFCLSMMMNYFSAQQKQRFTDRQYAIVFTPSVTVKGSPAASGTELFVVHEGLKVKIVSELGEWSEVQLSDGNVGWLPTKDIARI